MVDVDKIWVDLVVKWQEISRLHEEDKGVEIWNLINEIHDKYQNDATLCYDDIKLSYIPKGGK